MRGFYILNFGGPITLLIHVIAAIGMAVMVFALIVYGPRNSPHPGSYVPTYIGEENGSRYQDSTEDSQSTQEGGSCSEQQSQ